MPEISPLYFSSVEWAGSDWGLAFGVIGKLARPFSWAWESIRSRGVVTTIKIAIGNLEEACFDWRHGTETNQVVNSDQFESNLENRGHAVRYKATRARPFFALLQYLALPEGSTFVDVGSGKGKVLLLAAQTRFRRVVGVEFSPSLCVQAKRNIEIFRRRARPLAPIEVVQADIAQHEWDGDENVFFLYNPFDAVILAQFVEKLRSSMAVAPRQVWLIYSVPAHTEVLRQSGLFSKRDSLSSWGVVFHIYTNGCPDQTGSPKGESVGPETQGPSAEAPSIEKIDV